MLLGVKSCCWAGRAGGRSSRFRKRAEIPKGGAMHRCRSHAGQTGQRAARPSARVPDACRTQTRSLSRAAAGLMAGSRVSVDQAAIPRTVTKEQGWAGGDGGAVVPRPALTSSSGATGLGGLAHVVLGRPTSPSPSPRPRPALPPILAPRTLAARPPLDPLPARRHNTRLLPRPRPPPRRPAASPKPSPVLPSLAHLLPPFKMGASSTTSSDGPAPSSILSTYLQKNEQWACVPSVPLLVAG